MEMEAPTFNSLNKSQKRALILRDQLRFVDPHHLNEFLDGISNDEPPTYTKVNGTIKPPLVLVTLKEEATCFDLGNVQLPEEQNAIYRVYLVVENGHIQMRTEDPLPLDENVLDSQPIHGFIAQTMVPMFKEKFQTIFARMNKINEARRAAYNMPNQAPVLFHDGETLARLNPVKAEQGRTLAHVGKSRKREPNEDVVQHVSNKRKCTGLDTIPEDTKGKIFDTIPSHVKVDLFNSIVNTAFPNFNNLMTAAWNVITIYTSCGSDFPDLHKAIVDLKGVLQDFDESFGQRVDRAPPKYRNDFGGPSRGSAGGDRNQDRNGRRDQERRDDYEEDDVDHHGSFFESHVPTWEQGGVGDSSPVGDNTAKKAAQRQESFGEYGDGMEDSDGEDEEDDQVPPVDPRSTLTTKGSGRQSGSHHVAEHHVRGSSATSADDDDSSSEDRPLITVRPTSPDLARRHEAYASSVGKKRHEKSLVSEASPKTPQNAAITKESSAEDTDPHSERDQQTPQLQDSPTASSTRTSTPKSKKKKKQQRDISSYTIAELEKKCKERKAHIMTTFENDMSKVPEKYHKALESMEALLESRKKEEAQEKTNKPSGSPGKIGRPGVSSGGMFGTHPANTPGNFLGNSVLGAKKQTGVAPVAPMFPNGSRRDPRNGVAQGAPRKERIPYKFLKNRVGRIAD
ncbi:hypothetical protein ACET3X_008518 [Alternaria dauci]|uniref:Uncharacterized protein n=1 Tax=Alternaria dauci TaxID=48095 RepID=A0ABR3UD49_9PLEO